MNKKLVGIMAATSDGLIGCNNSLPWHQEEDLKFFEERTFGHYMIMGRKTYESLPARLLVDRKSIVFSRTIGDVENGIVVSSIEEFKQSISTINDDQIFMIGGSQIAHLFLQNSMLSSFLLTVIHGKYSGDSYLNLKYFDRCKKEILLRSKDFDRVLYSF